MSVVADTTVLSNFAGAAQLDLLRQLFGDLYLPAEVLAEIRAGLEEGYRFYEGVEALVHPMAGGGWLRLTGLRDEPELRAFGDLPPALHGGEAACIAIARCRGWTLLTDDRAARAEASRLGLRVSGTIGCLILAVERSQLVLQPSGAVVPGASRITVDLRDLKSDSDRRDGFIKMAVLQTAQYPLAEFVPERAQGLPSPLPAGGSATFTLAGPMTVRGVTREQTWQVTARREGTALTGTATTRLTFGDFGREPPRVPMVLSVVDEIRLELALVASQAA